MQAHGPQIENITFHVYTDPPSPTLHHTVRKHRLLVLFNSDLKYNLPFTAVSKLTTRLEALREELAGIDETEEEMRVSH